MQLKVFVDGQMFPIQIPEELVEEAKPFFDRMDRDMDRGWQMSRTWVDSPDAEQRCQIAADKMLTAMEQGNDNMIAMMAAYILYKMPDVREVYIDISGDMQETDIVTADALR
ncbi:MAG TPA: hypothetical protein ENK62_00395 [Chromatiales bacterium]|nr:hypothetical protein [Chromatiales bacterium]